MPITHSLNFHVGWSMVLAAFVTGALLGLRFHRDDFLGGYASFRRRMLRLGHIALAALGILNVVYSLCPTPGAGRWNAPWAGGCWIAGGILMPVICLLSAWQPGFRNLFFLPVAALIAAVVLTLI